MHYLYHEQRQETMAVEVEPATYAGRRYPVFNFGEHSLRQLALPMAIPFADDDWEAKTGYLEALLEARKAFIYRDKRGRLIYGVTDSLDWSDIPIGTAVALKIQAAEFDEEIA